MDRRRFLRYVGAGVVAAAGAGAGYYLYSKQAGYPTTPTQTVAIPKGWETASTYLKNHPPIANFKYKPYYLAPTDEQSIQFTNLSEDPDDDSLRYTWLVDDQIVSHEKDYSTKLSEGDHSVALKVSDGKSETTNYATVTIVPDQIYPTKPLRIKYKGVHYLVGNPFVNDPWSQATPTPEKRNEQLDTIRNELGCNAIVLIAGDGTEDNLVEGCKSAEEKGFERIYAQIRYTNFTLDGIAKKLTDLAPRMRKLREMSESIVFEFGCEFTFSSKGIIPGNTYPERIEYAYAHSDWSYMMGEKLPEYFKRVIPIIKNEYGYPAGYLANGEEVHLVPWSDSVFGSVDFMAYIADRWHQNESFILGRLADLQRFRKPISLAEWGCRSARGAGALDPAGDYDLSKPYDEDEQANYIARYCNMVNKVNANKPLASGMYCYDYYEDWDKGFGLLTYNNSGRKKGFYMYKSYQRVS